MPSPVQDPPIGLRQFVDRMAGRSVELDQAEADPTLGGVDLTPADLNGDRVISGGAEFSEAFELIAQAESSGRSNMLQAVERNGQPTRGGERLSALTRLAESPTVDELLPVGNAAATDAANYTRGACAAHRDAVNSRGYGTHVGVESSYCDLNGQQKLAWLQQARTDGAARIDRPRESSCIGYVMECVQSYYESAGEADRFREIQRRVVGDDSRGTTLLQELQTDGWQLL
ncbi:MAG: hypothetical protein AAFQ82_24695, partial [Myxococcota bacterium]